VFLDPSRRQAALVADVATLLVRLNATGVPHDLATFADSRLLESHLTGATQSEIAAQFGDEFASALVDLPLGRWHGPVESGYGVHLVRIEARQPGQLPPLSEVRDAVAREWSATKRREMKEAHLRALLARHPVRIEDDPTCRTPGKLALVQR
jgi:hypothetical protein